jgi:hypothetical protein
MTGVDARRLSWMRCDSCENWLQFKAGASWFSDWLVLADGSELTGKLLGSQRSVSQGWNKEEFSGIQSSGATKTPVLSYTIYRTGRNMFFRTRDQNGIVRLNRGR